MNNGLFKRKTLQDVNKRVEGFIGEYEQVAVNAQKDLNDTEDQIDLLSNKRDEFANELAGATIAFNNFRKILTEELS